MNKLKNNLTHYLTLLFGLIGVMFVYGNNSKVEQSTIRNVATGNVNGKEVLFVSDLSSQVGCYSLGGKKIWNYKLDVPAVIFEIIAKDVNGDGNDNLLAASANGTIYCWQNNGELLWKYTPEHKVRFSEIAVANTTNGVRVFAGGNDYLLYELDNLGVLVSTTKIEGVVRKIEVGNFKYADKESIFLMTYGHDKFRWEFMGFLDVDTKKAINTINYKKVDFPQLKKAMITDISIADVDKDGLKDVLMFGDASFVPVYCALNGDFEVVSKFVASRKSKQRYSHTKGICLLPIKEEVFMQNGGFKYRLALDGELIEKAGTRYASKGELVYSDFTIDRTNEKLIAAGGVDGGNGIYSFDLSKSNWVSTYHKLQGTMDKVSMNISQLYKQTLDFKIPSYQKKTDKEWVMVTSVPLNNKVKKLQGSNVKFVIQKSPKENTNRAAMVAAMGKIALKKDKRGNYDLTRSEIVQIAKDYEKQKQPFTFWAGHGNDPFYIQIETLEQILEAAPTMCYGFVYAEMANVNDPRVVHFVNEYVPRLAKAIRKNNKAKLYFRYKNTFWALTSNMSPWKELFFSKKYADILMPASEDTSSRTQDINLSGRVGMFLGGYVNDFAMRLVDDNPTSWRPFSPGGQKSVSPYLRQGVLMAAYGAKYGVLFDNKFIDDEGLNVLFALMKSGVLPQVQREELVSIGSWHLIKDVDKHLIEGIDNHHNLKQYKSTDDSSVFSVTQMHWAGTSIPNHDYSKIALGVSYRWLNYIPKMPYGMVPIAPYTTKQTLDKHNVDYSVSNGDKGYLDGELVSAKNYEIEFSKIVKNGANKMPIVVKGASWSAIQLDEKHVRLILLDPGYIEPADTKATIVFQHKKPKTGIDILSKEEIVIKETIELVVPAGSMRFVDFEF